MITDVILLLMQWWLFNISCQFFLCVLYISVTSYQYMGVFLVIGLVLSGAAVTSAIILVSEHMYVVSEKIHAHLFGQYAPRRCDRNMSRL